MTLGADTRPLNLLEVCAKLVERGLTPEQIGNMDQWWIQHVYFHKRDKHGEVEIRRKDRNEAQAMTDREKFFAWGKRLLIPEWHIQELWIVKDAELKAKRAARKKRDQR